MKLFSQPIWQQKLLFPLISFFFLVKFIRHFTRKKWVGAKILLYLFHQMSDKVTPMSSSQIVTDLPQEKKKNRYPHTLMNPWPLQPLVFLKRCWTSQPILRAKVGVLRNLCEEYEGFYLLVILREGVFGDF